MEEPPDLWDWPFLARLSWSVPPDLQEGLPPTPVPWHHLLALCTGCLVPWSLGSTDLPPARDHVDQDTRRTVYQLRWCPRVARAQTQFRAPSTRSHH